MSPRVALAALLALATGCPRAPTRDGGADATADADASADAARDAPRDVATGCAVYGACGTCTGAPGCGWCLTSASCAHGTASGADDASCADWDFVGGRCDPDAGTGCAAHADCAGCATDPACGWCATSGTCAAGDVRGPFGAACATTAWDFTGDQCAVDAGADGGDAGADGGDAAPDASGDD